MTSGSEIRKASITTADGSVLNYFLRGDGEPVLFLHGFPTSGMLWDEIAKIMCDKFTCVYVDLPGWGESDTIAAHGSEVLEASIPIFEALEEACGQPIRNIASTDAGAVIAAYYAAVRPDRIKRLVLMSAPLWPDFTVPLPMRVLRAPFIGKVAGFLIKPLMFWRLGLEGRDLEHYSEEHRRAFSHPFRGFLGGTKLADRVRWGDPYEVMTPLSKVLPDIEARTLVVHCSDDSAVPESMAVRTTEAIRDARQLTLEGPHFIPLTHPELVAGHLSDFFAES